VGKGCQKVREEGPREGEREMTDAQLYFAIGLSCLTVITSLIISLFMLSGVREDTREIRADLKNIIGKLGGMDVELGKLMDKANELHARSQKQQVRLG
jgi:hypothetical protein